MKEEEREDNQIEMMTTFHNCSAFELSVNMPRIIHYGQRQISGFLLLTPLMNLKNMPLSLQLKGYSKCQKIIEEEGGEHFIQKQSFRSKSATNKLKQQQSSQAQDIIEYFIEGDQILYQLDQQKQIRLQKLQKGVVYKYPYTFPVPANLPPTLDHKCILNELSVVIHYFFLISASPQSIQNSSLSPFTLNLPLNFQSQHKNYPYTIQATNQKIRVYHPSGPKTLQSSFLNSLGKCFCQCFCPKKKQFYSYFLLLLQIQVSVNQNHLFVIARLYLDPQAKTLISNRMKSQHQSIIKLDTTATEAAEEEHHSAPALIQSLLGSNSITIDLIGSMSFPQVHRIIATKQISLKESNLDMMEGECVIELSDNKSYSNELFTVEYFVKNRINWLFATEIEEEEHKKIVL